MGWGQAGVQPGETELAGGKPGILFYLSPAPCRDFIPLLLPRLANKNIGRPVMLEFQINNEYIFSISMAPVLQKCPVSGHSTS